MSYQVCTIVGYMLYVILSIGLHFPVLLPRWVRWVRYTTAFLNDREGGRGITVGAPLLIPSFHMYHACYILVRAKPRVGAIGIVYRRITCY